MRGKQRAKGRRKKEIELLVKKGDARGEARPEAAVGRGEAAPACEGLSAFASAENGKIRRAAAYSKIHLSMQDNCWRTGGVGNWR